MEEELDLKAEVKKRAALVDKAIKKYLPISHPEELYKASRHLLDAGGKRLRPVMLMLAAEAVLGDLENVIPAAVAVELVHNFTLIHDDIMDEDELRRGMPAVHVKWDTSSAILAGDTLCCKAFEILAKSKAEPKRIVASIDILSRALTEICEGQWLDLDFEKRETVSIREYLEMVRKKTGMLLAA
ncbi:MAG: polyprenyl synthetase family protein, partial [Methanocellales archaeon]